MKQGLIFDIKKYAMHDGPGIRTTVFFKGCPLNCQWCHNPESRKPESEFLESDRSRNNGRKAERIGKHYGSDQLMTELLKDRVFYEQSGGGVTFSGGEPMLQVDFLQEVLEKCRQQGLHSIVDTSGFVPFEEFEKILDQVDTVYYDIKLVDSKKHEMFTGYGNELILENLKRLDQAETDVVVRIPLIPNITDTDDNLEECRLLMQESNKLNKVSLLPYNKFGEDKRIRFKLSNNLPLMQKQTKSVLNQKADIFRRHGLEVKIGG